MAGRTQSKDPPLFLRRRCIRNLIALRDENERALTYTLGYVIAKSFHFCKRFIEHALEESVEPKDVSSVAEGTCGVHCLRQGFVAVACVHPPLEGDIGL